MTGIQCKGCGLYKEQSDFYKASKNKLITIKEN